MESYGKLLESAKSMWLTSMNLHNLVCSYKVKYVTYIVMIGYYVVASFSLVTVQKKIIIKCSIKLCSH